MICSSTGVLLFGTSLTDCQRSTRHPFRVFFYDWRMEFEESGLANDKIWNRTCALNTHHPLATAAQFFCHLFWRRAHDRFYKESKLYYFFDESAQYMEVVSDASAPLVKQCIRAQMNTQIAKHTPRYCKRSEGSAFPGDGWVQGKLVCRVSVYQSRPRISNL